MADKKEIDDRFKKFGTVSFTSVTRVNEFITYLEKGQMMGTRCKSCGQVFFRRAPIASSASRATSNGLKFRETESLSPTASSSSLLPDLRETCPTRSLSSTTEALKSSAGFQKMFPRKRSK